MDEHIEQCAQLFSAAKSEFRQIETCYFHNFIYESVWPENERRAEDKQSVLDLFRRFRQDYKVIFVGDAAMATYEITHSGGSIDFMNREPGANWLNRFTETYDKAV